MPFPLKTGTSLLHPLPLSIVERVIIELTNEITIVKDWIILWKRLSSIQLDIMLRKAGVARVDRRLRRYYLIVRLLPNVFALA